MFLTLGNQIMETRYIYSNYSSTNNIKFGGEKILIIVAGIVCE